ncbi:radical SAM protein [Sandaracinus amylolyticus]|uniref:Molybdenum cofactor biosynthesis protein MoaA n=1 Tax=Sandaracinus amylolyticus TaxID=927083 RepID=A0A0F6SGL9_9BACT|nr:radical SAM protein [Sandaracinus amylolyticus]AKF08924.1 Molybdenum cofactor biosynthesis protein MoaA [Sandaracinus amylolyticus]
MAHRARDYLFYSATRALCGTCLRVVDAKELIEGDRVWLWKRCPEHGIQRVLLSDDAAYFRRGREVFLKPPEQVARYNTPHEHGCPYDCGICPDHEQHGCVSILEITDHCNLRCPTCYASSGPERLAHRPLDVIERMLDRIVANETEPDVLQVSGGEPTTHPDFFAVLDACRRRPVRHLMLNTNGIRIAKEDGFAERLASYAPRFEVYLQLDSLRRSAHLDLRGADLRAIRERALEKLDALNLSTTLVCTVKRGVNDDELGDLLRFASQHRAVRGVTFQPVQDAGRNETFDPGEHRLTLSEVRRRITEQCDLFAPEDLLPVPCHPECLAMAYGIKSEDGTRITPLTRYVDPRVLLDAGRNTIVYEGDRDLTRAIFSTFSTAHGPESAAGSLHDLLCCLPRVEALPSLGYDRVFRVIIMQFLDRHSMDLRSVRKSCVHIAHPDGTRVMPFDTYNVLYRDHLEAEVLAPLRAAVGGQGVPSARKHALRTV